MDKPPDLDPNVWTLMEKHRTRAEFGKQKYGVDTTRTDLGLGEWLTHLQEELMDAAIYVEAVRNEMAKGFRGRYYNAMCRTDNCGHAAHYWDREHKWFVCKECAVERNVQSWTLDGRDVCSVFILQASHSGRDPASFAQWAHEAGHSEELLVRKYLQNTGHSDGFREATLKAYRELCSK